MGGTIFLYFKRVLAWEKCRKCLGCRSVLLVVGSAKKEI